MNVETVGGVNVDMLYITVTHLEADSSMIQAEMEAAEASVEAEADTQPDAQDEYVLYASDLVMVTDQDLEGLSQEQLRIAVNEIYARHGRKFNSEELQTYFNSKSWYQGTIAPDQFDESVLNEVEKANIQKISDKRNGTSSSGSTFEQGWIYGSYYQDLGEGGISAEIGFYSGTGEDYITLEGSYFDSYGYFSGTIVYTGYSSMYAIDENGNTIYFEYNGSSKITVTSGDNTGGMNFPGFTGTYQKTADLPKDVG